MVTPEDRAIVSKTVANGVQTRYCVYTNEALADLLHALDLPFVWGDPQRAPDVPADLTDVIAALASNDEARLRLALIPLLLRHPSFAQYVKTAAVQLSGDALFVLRCYYTAAFFLQQTYWPRLEALFGSLTPLPDLFSADLRLPTGYTPEAGLQALAARHRALSGQSINWLGTYEHGAQRLLRYCEKRQGWQQSPLTTFAHS